MTLTLNLTPELEQYLKQKAEQQGLSVEAYALQLLTEQILVAKKQAKTVNLLQSWLEEEDVQEQTETVAGSTNRRKKAEARTRTPRKPDVCQPDLGTQSHEGHARGQLPKD